MIDRHIANLQPVGGGESKQGCNRVTPVRSLRVGSLGVRLTRMYAP